MSGLSFFIIFFFLGFAKYKASEALYNGDKPFTPPLKEYFLFLFFVFFFLESFIFFFLDNFDILCVPLISFFLLLYIFFFANV